MGIFKKVFSKTASVGKKLRHDEKKHEEYECVDVAKKKYGSKRGAPELVLADAPQRPTFGGKGLESNATYAFESEDEQSRAPRKAASQSAPPSKDSLPPFGQPPGSSQPPKPAEGQPGGGGEASAAGALHNGKPPGPELPGLGSGNAPLGEAHPLPVVPDIPPRQAVVVSVMVLLKGALAAYLAFLALFTAWLRPRLSTLLLSALVGAGLGAGYSWLFLGTRRFKRLLNEGFNVQPGRKGMLELLGQVPTWISFQERERVAWANAVMRQMWQYYDKAVGDAIIESVEPIMDQYKPPGIVKKIYFKRLTFGDLPLTIDDVWVENEGENHVLLEASFRLAGDSNIEIAIEMAAGGTATRMVPKVTDLQVAGRMRVILSPLLPEVPGFGAVVFSLTRPPMVHFDLNFGSSMGGGVSAGLVRMWLDPFLRETLASLIVWPNRMVFPMLPESPENNLEALGIKNVGLLEVRVIEAKGLDKQDLIGKSDPLVELWTQKSHVEATAHKKKTLEPHWDERFHFLVQEPKTQALRLQVYDWDTVHFKELLSGLNPLQGLRDSFGAKTFMARVAVPIRPFYDQPGKMLEQWHDLGRREWSDEDGTGKGHGSLRLEARYWPFHLLYSKPRTAKLGAVLVTLRSAADLPAADSNGLSDPFAKLQLGDQKRQSGTHYDTLRPEWNEKFEFIKVGADSVLRVQLFDEDPLDPDDPLGLVEVHVGEEVAPAPSGTIEKVYFLREVPPDAKTKEVKKASVVLKIQWVPFDFDPDA